MRKNMIWVAVAAMSMMVAMPSCSSEEEREKIENEEPEQNPDENQEQNPDENQNNVWQPIRLSAEQRQLVNQNNDFAFNLFRMATLGGVAGPCFQAPSSIIHSPIRLTYALGMLNNGAAGETQEQINNVLGFGNTGADGINAFCQKMLTEAPALDKLTKVMIADNIYMNKDYRLTQDFVQKANEFYNAQPETRDFADGKTRDVINKWASDHTEGMIPEVLKEGEFSPSAVSYLLNAIYFKGMWSEKFDKSQTKDEAFEGQQKKVPMMHQEHEFNYTENDLCQALRLPYGNGAYSMTILLPREGVSVGNVISSLAAENWWQYQNMGSAIVDVKLPRFESNTDISLTNIMINLGMPKAFTDLAEFPNFCQVATKIDIIKQVARIKLDEAGSEAAAVTVIGMVEATCVEPQEQRHVQFHATRPFLYIISEHSTGAIFFIGKYIGD